MRRWACSQPIGITLSQLADENHIGVKAFERVEAGDLEGAFGGAVNTRRR